MALKEYDDAIQELNKEETWQEIKHHDVHIALSIAGFAGINTRDARGNLLPTLWTKYFDESDVGLLLERNDVRALLLKQIESQIKSRRDLLEKLDENDVLVRWIMDFSSAWEKQYALRKHQQYDISQMILSIMQEAFRAVEPFMEQYSTIRPSEFRIKLESEIRQLQDAASKNPETKKIKFLHGTEALVRFFFREENTSSDFCHVAGKFLKKQEVCNKAGSYSSRVQRNDITREVDYAVDGFCRLFTNDSDTLKKCTEVLQDKARLARLLVDHRGFPSQHQPTHEQM